ncbi:MAG: PilN domain-containing protein [Candidatus Omnitrophota bacterium]|nr:PilN domain-containing protein [Candidatus Omnitrophota bacterium]
MIEINLLPAELKVQKKQNSPAAVRDLRRFLYIIPAIIALIIILHIYLAVLMIGKNNLLHNLSKKWEAAAPQRKELEDFNKKYAAMSEDIEAIRGLGEKRIEWAQKLDRLSLDLPAGIWFRTLVLKPGQFSLEGSVISLQKEEINQIKEFIENLKKDDYFFKEFDNLELSSVERRVLGSYDIIDFVLSAKAKL